MNPVQRVKRAIYNVGYKNFHGEFLLERFNIENKNKMSEIDNTNETIRNCILYFILKRGGREEIALRKGLTLQEE